MSTPTDRVVIGMDPHKGSVTIEVMGADETILGGGHVDTDAAGVRSMLRYAKQWPERTWAIEGCQGVGKHVAMRLLADEEAVVDVPPKMSARVRVFATGQGRKTDATDAHSVALVGARTSEPRPVINDEQIAVLRILVDPRRALGEDHRHMVDDAAKHSATGPGGQTGHDSDSSATGSHPNADPSEKPLPGPATRQPKPALPAGGPS